MKCQITACRSVQCHSPIFTFLLMSTCRHFCCHFPQCKLPAFRLRGVRFSSNCHLEKQDRIYVLWQSFSLWLQFHLFVFDSDLTFPSCKSLYSLCQLNTRRWVRKVQHPNHKKRSLTCIKCMFVLLTRNEQWLKWVFVYFGKSKFKETTS